jgi:hypothetical protein
VLTGRKIAGAVAAPAGVLAYRFVSARDGSTVVAAWSPAADALLRLETKPMRVVRINAVGEERELTASGGGVQVELKKGAPVYVSVQ